MMLPNSSSNAKIKLPENKQTTSTTRTNQARRRTKCSPPQNANPKHETKLECKSHQSLIKISKRRNRTAMKKSRDIITILLVCVAGANLAATSTLQDAPHSSSIRFDPISSGYSGLTFSFDPRLDKRVETLHFEHWLSIMQQTSSLMHDSLSGRAHLASVQVLIPYKWRHNVWPVLHKPGVPIMSNRLLKYAHSDVIVGFEDPIYRETPYAIQHDECAMQGHNIHMPISFLERDSSPGGLELDVRLKARMLLREFASHRFGLFKESGFRQDPAYPPFNALPGHAHMAQQQQQHQRAPAAANQSWTMQSDHSSQSSQLSASQANSLAASSQFQLKGFDPKWNECAFETQPANGLPAAHALQCAPYLVRAAEGQPGQQAASKGASGNNPLAFNDNQQSSAASASFNLMSADPFSHVSLSRLSSSGSHLQQPPPPPVVEWADLVASSESGQGPRWHFCGEQFAQGAPASAAQMASQHQHQFGKQANKQQQPAGQDNPSKQQQHHPHNPLALNKQNVMCNERAAMDIIRLSEDFRRTAFSGSTFNRLPETSFKFVQEMPPRVVLGVEYSAHLYQAHRLEHGILEAAIGKWLTYDMIADSEFGLVLFGQAHSHRYPFKRLDASLDARPTLYSPPIDPFDEPPRLYSEHELLQHFDISGLAAPPGGSPTTANQQQPHQIPAIIKGTCSLARLLAEAQHLASQGSKYDDQGVDYVVITSGLFVEDEAKIEELLKDFKSSSVQLNLIIYPASMLFDTKSYPINMVVLDQAQSEAIVRNRISKLLTIKRLTNAKIHLVREHVDANNDVRMSTLLQFYQIFQHISSGHSWDQTNAMITLNQEQVVEATRMNTNQQFSKLLISNSGGQTQASNSALYKLQFQFQLDSSLENELIVGFIDPKSQSFKRQSGKRFSLRNLQLRSPTGQLVLMDPTTAGAAAAASSLIINNTLHNQAEEFSEHPPSGPLTIQEQLIADQEETLRATNTITDSALFPYRSQLGLAGFHLRSAHLLSALSNGTRRASGAAGVWTLSAVSEEPLQASAIAMARLNPAGDSISASCWLQTYDVEQEQHQQNEILEDRYSSSSAKAATNGANNKQQPNQKMVKVFVQLKGAPDATPPLETYSRMEVEDESGNIVQNVNLLDDGLGVPDMTRNDGIHTQYVQPRVQAPGFYRVRVEVSGGSPSSPGHHQYTMLSNNMRQIRQQSTNNIKQSAETPTGGVQWPSIRAEASSSSGQDTPCCGSFMPSSGQHQHQTRYLSRQLYCGTFYLEPGTRLGPQQPPRINTLSVHSVDQDTRRVRLRWFEPLVDINHAVEAQQQQQQTSSSDPMAQNGASSARYEIKMFTDRDAAKRAFDAKPDVGFQITEQLIDGSMLNVSSFGGQRDLTMRVPYAREGMYFVAMKVYNNAGFDSPLSNIVQFWIRANHSQLNGDSVDSLYGQPTTTDADGNVYDKNGELLHQRVSSNAGWNNHLSSSGPHQSAVSQLMGSIDGLSLVMLLSLGAFLFCLMCISLVACLSSSSQRRRHHQKSSSTTSLKRKSAGGGGGGSSSSTSSDKPAMILAGGSSLASSSQSASSQQSELASSNSVQSDPCELMDGHNHAKTIEGLISEHESKYSSHHIMEQHQHQQVMQQQQRHLVTDWQQQHQNQIVMSGEQLYQRQQHHLNQQQLIQHNMINGYAYATINLQQQQQHPINLNYDVVQNEYQLENGAHDNGQSWTTDVLQNHYDKVKQARERNENPPILRVSDSLDASQSQGLPIVQDVCEIQHQGAGKSALMEHSYLLGRPSSRANGLVGLGANPLNQQLQQQLSSVLRNKRLSMTSYTTNSNNNNLDANQQDPSHTSPALEGLTDQLSDLEVSPSGGAPIAIERLVIPPPPPHYIYDSSQISAALNPHSQQAVLTEPSIYSQLTNLQPANLIQQNNSDQYYANQWEFSAQKQHQFHEQNNNNNNQDQISPANNAHQYHSLEQPNGAISDV